MVERIKWQPETMPDRYRAIDRAVLEFHGDGAEGLLWVGVDGHVRELERRLKYRNRTYAILGSSILDGTARFSPAFFAHENGREEPVMLGFEALSFQESPDMDQYESADRSKSLADLLHVAYQLPAIPYDVAVRMLD